MPAVRFAKPGKRRLIEVSWNGEAVQGWSERIQNDRRRSMSVMVGIGQSTHLAECLQVRIDQSIQVETKLKRLSSRIELACCRSAFIGRLIGLSCNFRDEIFPQHLWSHNAGQCAAWNLSCYQRSKQ